MTDWYVRHPGGVVISLPRSSFPQSSALRASTCGLKSDDPSGASPLRDRQAVAAGEGSVNRIAQRQGVSLLCFKTQMRHPRLVRPSGFSDLSGNRFAPDRVGSYPSGPLASPPHGAREPQRPITFLQKIVVFLGCLGIFRQLWA